MNITTKKIAIIGAGPSGISQLVAFKKAEMNGEPIPNIICYEKQHKAGGQWNYDWRTSIGDNDEFAHSSMYKKLVSNAPKESLYFPDYSFEEHFDCAIPSFPPRSAIKNYLDGYIKKFSVQKLIQFNTVVRSVKYLSNINMFEVITYDYNDNKTQVEHFNNVIVANGHFSVPNIPVIEGIEHFEGRVIHSHDFRDAKEFKNQRVLIVGASHSAEDIGSHCYKYGCKQIIRSFRSKPITLSWPEIWQDVPLLKQVEKNKVYFIDGSYQEVDSIIFCTGYKHHFPFLADELKLKTGNRLWIKNLYKGVFWEHNTNLIYLGMQDQIYTFPLFFAQASYVRDVILEKIAIPSKQDITKDNQKWIERESKLNIALDSPEPIIYQSDYIADLMQHIDYTPEFNFHCANQIFFDFLKHRSENIMTFRDQAHTSMITGAKSPTPPLTWLKDFTSDKFEDYIKCYQT